MDWNGQPRSSLEGTTMKTNNKLDADRPWLESFPVPKLPLEWRGVEVLLKDGTIVSGVYVGSYWYEGNERKYRSRINIDINDFNPNNILIAWRELVTDKPDKK